MSWYFFIGVVTVLYQTLPGQITLYLYLHSTLWFMDIDCICTIRAVVRCTKRNVRYSMNTYYTALPFCVNVSAAHVIHKHILDPQTDTNNNLYL